MRNRLCKLPRCVLPILVLLAGISYATPAAAHKVNLFAAVQGQTIQGEVYFRGGGPARDAKVTMVGPSGEVLGETTTDERGEFTFAIRSRCDHKLIADVGEGHGAEYTVPAEELPDELPVPGSPENASREQPGEAEPLPAAKRDEEASPAAPDEHVATIPDRENLKAEIKAVGRQVIALREDLNAYKSHLRYQDVIAGLGYILGVMGLVFYFLGVRRKEKRSAKGNP